MITFPLEKRAQIVLWWLLQGQTIELEFYGELRTMGMTEGYRVLGQFVSEKSVDGELVRENILMGPEMTIGDFLGALEKLPEDKLVELAANVALNKARSR